MTALPVELVDEPPINRTADEVHGYRAGWSDALAMVAAAERRGRPWWDVAADIIAAGIVLFAVAYLLAHLLVAGGVACP